MNKNTMVKFVDGKVAPTARRWLANKNMLLLFDEAEPFLYFLDKYGMIMVSRWGKGDGKILQGKQQGQDTP